MAANPLGSQKFELFQNISAIVFPKNWFGMFLQELTGISEPTPRGFEGRKAQDSWPCRRMPGEGRRGAKSWDSEGRQTGLQNLEKIV